jgi:hypothetical protein
MDSPPRHKDPKTHEETARRPDSTTVDFTAEDTETAQRHNSPKGFSRQGAKHAKDSPPVVLCGLGGMARAFSRVDSFSRMKGFEDQ